MNEVKIIPVKGLPEIKPGDDLAELTFKSLTENKTEVLSNDVFIFTQKIVSKSEGMAKNLNEISFEELLESQTKYVIRKRGDLVISKTKHGFICANAGIDKSNVENNYALLLPEDPNKSAKYIRNNLIKLLNVEVSVIISDTFGRAWRKGQVNFAIGSSGIKPIASYIGTLDSFNNELHATEVAIIDELASAGELVMAKSIDVPIAIIRGYNYEQSSEDASELIRNDNEDFFL